jgi:hypothetical protein
LARRMTGSLATSATGSLQSVGTRICARAEITWPGTME